MERNANYWIRRRLSRRGFVAGSTGAVAGAAAFATVGCGGDDDDSDPTTAPGETSTAPAGGETPAASATADGSSRPAPSGSLRVSVATLMDQSADPFYQTGGLARAIETHAFNKFFRSDDDGQRELDLAESFEVAPDRMSMTFKMRPGVKFWDGTEMTAEDAAWSYEAYINRTPPNPNAATIQNIVESVEAIDTSTVLVNLKTPTPFQGQEIAWWNISSQAYYEEVGEDEFQRSGIGTGPFRISQNEQGQFMEMEAFTEHWNQARVPYIESFRFLIVPELTTRIAQLRTNETDIAEGVTGATALQLQSESGIRIVTGPETAWLKINFFEAQAKTEPWTDKRLREALVISIDQESIATGLLRQGRPSPNVQLWPKTMGYDESLFPAREFDPDRARQLIQEAGLEGFSITVNSYASSSYPLIPEVMQAVSGYWNDIGLDTQVVQHESGGYFTGFTSRTLEGVGPNGWPFSNDARLIASTAYRTGSPYGSTDDYAEIESGLEEMFAAETEEEQFEIAQQIHKYVYDEFLFATGPWSDSQWAVTDKVKEWIRPAGDPYLTRLESVQLEG